MGVLVLLNCILKRTGKAESRQPDFVKFLTFLKGWWRPLQISMQLTRGEYGKSEGPKITREPRKASK